MVCVGLSEGDMKNFGGPLGGQAKFWGTVATPAPHPSSAPGDIPTPLHVLKMLRPETDVSPSPLATPLSSRQNYKFASSYAYSQIY